MRKMMTKICLFCDVFTANMQMSVLMGVLARKIALYNPKRSISCILAQMEMEDMAIRPKAGIKFLLL